MLEKLPGWLRLPNAGAGLDRLAGGNLGDIPLKPELPFFHADVLELIVEEVLTHGFGLGDIWLIDMDFDMSVSVRLTGLLSVGDLEAALFWADSCSARILCFSCKDKL